MQGLSMIVATDDARRFHAALEVAAASAALGRQTRVFLQAQAVSLVGDESDAPPGLPSAQEMLNEALALGVRISACQSGLALARVEAGALPTGVETEGLVSFLVAAKDDQLLMA
jgi:predicted peroxiredoxin